MNKLVIKAKEFNKLRFKEQERFERHGNVKVLKSIKNKGMTDT